MTLGSKHRLWVYDDTLMLIDRSVLALVKERSITLVVLTEVASPILLIAAYMINTTELVIGASNRV